MEIQKFEVLAALLLSSGVTFFFGYVASICLITGWVFNYMWRLWEQGK